MGISAGTCMGVWKEHRQGCFGQPWLDRERRILGRRDECLERQFWAGRIHSSRMAEPTAQYNHVDQIRYGLEGTFFSGEQRH